ncbi:heme peroxidase [Hysterangium stoloniferum]|nr:heme peroxidase [Hysterangium stoloniferum]
MSNGYASVPNALTVGTEEQGVSWVPSLERVASYDFSSILGKTESPPLSDDFDAPAAQSKNSIVQLIEGQIKRGSPISFPTISALWDALKNQNGVGLDDRKFLLEYVLVLMSRLPPGSQIATQIEHFMIDFLYKDLPHPPSTYLRPYVASTASPSALSLKGFAWREADGSNNNPLVPELGASHKPYARSVSASHIAPPATLPDPGLIFDTLLKRSSNVPHPTGLSSMFFAFANLIIHSLFHTNRYDSSINDTSSYLDLSPLYGVDFEEQKKVRRFDGTGRLYEDTFADNRLLGMPPAIAALLVIFCRNHNFVATRILEINESGAYQANPSDDIKAKQDDEIFNRARLVNCGAFMQVIMRDYVGSILHMIQDLNPWHLRPLDPMRDSSHDITPRGEGNVCSVEFNLLYRWHATTSAKDEKWLDELFKTLLPDETPETITKEKFYAAAAREVRMKGGPDPKTWTIGSMKRDPSGRFSDADLANTLQSATDDAAQAFRARGIPAAFRIIEILGIEQARSWGVCSLNEFRTFLGLKPYGSFEEWNPDLEIAAAARHLYHDIDNMELYVGMQAEESRRAMPGSGLCSGYTMSRSILADAVALIRGDRFLTTEYTPFNLTSWGFQDVQTTNDNGSLGGMLTKLLFRALPQHYTPSSIYAHFPFILPSSIKQAMTSKDPAMVKKYDWNPPHVVAPIVPVHASAAVKEVLETKSTFYGNYEALSSTLTGDISFYYGGPATNKNAQEAKMIHDILFTPVANAKHGQYYYDKALELVADKSYSGVGVTTRTVDIVREVLNSIPLHWITTHVADLSLITPEQEGKFTEEELYGYFAVIFSYIFFNTEPVNAWFLAQHSQKAAKTILGDLSSKLPTGSIAGAVRGVVNKLTGLLHEIEGKHETTNALQQLLKQSGGEMDEESRDEVLTKVFGIMVNSVPNWAHAATHVINFYLKPARDTDPDPRKSDREQIVMLAGRKQLSQNEENQLIGYVWTRRQVGGVLREVHASLTSQNIKVSKGERVFVDLHAGLRKALPDHDSVNPRRPRTEQPVFVPGAHSSLSEEFSDKTMAQVLRAVFSKKNVRRGPGSSGQLVRFTENFHGTSQTLYIDSKGQSTAWPQSLIIQVQYTNIDKNSRS